MPTTNGTTPERSIGELFGELASETGTLVRQEVQLATTEIGQKAAQAGKQSIMIMTGALLGVVSLVTLAAGIVVLLARWVPLYASALIVAAVFGVIAYAVAHAGLRALKTMSLKPTETLASLKDNKTWATKQLQ
ncbi:MAG: phage holin family protein [Deltaproteobacteria bacterium]|nr:phage holin family protein [Deltaproteobacteria bacterium]